MRMSSKKIVISAAYGMGNIGDEAICETIMHDVFSVDPGLDVTVLVFDKKLFLKAHPEFIGKKNIRIRSMDFRRGSLLSLKKIIDITLGIIAVAGCDVFIWGGGNLIRNKKYWLNIYIKPILFAQVFNKRIIVWSIGIDEISNSEVKRLVGKIRKISFFSVRDKASKDNMAKISSYVAERDIAVVRDPVFHFSHGARDARADAAKRVGFNITFWKADFTNTDETERFADSFSKILNAVHAKTEAKLVYLPSAAERDQAMYELLLKRLDPAITVEYPAIETPEEYVRNLSNLDVFIGMRMHSIIMASNVKNLPILGIIYDEKVQALNDEEGLDRMFFSINDLVDHPERAEEKITSALQGAHTEVDFNGIQQDSKKMLEVFREYITHE